MRLLAALLVLLVLAGCGGPTPASPTAGQPGGTPTTSPTSPGGPSSSPGATPATPPATADSGTSPPPPSADPNATPPPIVRQPLPEPELDDPGEIGEAIANPVPERRLQGVVSMLRGLGIGIYRHDGSPIRAGDERRLGDLWLYEDEVRALAGMAAAESPRDFISFRDWHAALAELGLSISADELIAAYVETYLYDFNESFFTEVLLAQNLDMYDESAARTRLTRLQAWLLLLDGFAVGKDASAVGRPIAHAGPAPLLVATNHDRAKWGGASSKLPRLISDADVSLDNVAAFAARLETLARSVPFTISPAGQTAHEGHEGEASPVRFEVWFRPEAVAFAAPFGDDFFLAPLGQSWQLPISWQAADAETLRQHGRLVDDTGSDPLEWGSRTDSFGRVSAAYTARQEEAGGEGPEATEVVQLSARASVADIAERTWHVPPTLLGYLRSLGGDVPARPAGEPYRESASLTIEWHELHGLRIDMRDDYDVRLELPRFRGAEMSIGEVRKVGTETFRGFLALQDDGTYRGVVDATVNAEYYERAFDQECSTSLVARQKLLVVGEPTDADHPQGPGDPLLLRFYPIEPPQIDRLGCNYGLDYYYGSEYYEDPLIPRDEQIPSGQFGPFNDQRVVNPAERGFRTAKPEFGSRTYIYEEHAEGIGGGTWTVTVEVVEPTQ